MLERAATALRSTLDARPDEANLQLAQNTQNMQTTSSSMSRTTLLNIPVIVPLIMLTSLVIRDISLPVFWEWKKDKGSP